MFRNSLVLAAFAVLFLAATANAGVITNGDFGTGDFSGWTVTPAGAFAFVSEPGYLGDYEAILGGDGTLSQTFATTALQPYFVEFFLANDDFANSNSFSILWNGTPALLAASNSDAFDYTLFSFKDVAQGSSTTLAFDFQNDNSVFHLDDVSVSPTPEPGAVWLLGSGLLGLIGLKKILSCRLV